MITENWVTVHQIMENHGGSCRYGGEGDISMTRQDMDNKAKLK